MDVSQATTAQVQGAQNQRHQHMTIGDRISKMESAIGDAAQSGTLTGDQATHMKKELAEITKLLSHNSHKQNGSNSQTRSSTPLSADDREKIRSDLQDLGKQVVAALNPQGAAGAAAARGAQAEVLKPLDTNFDGKIGNADLKKELEDITKILSHNSHKQNGSNNQTGSSTPLSADDLQKIRSDLHGLGKQLFTALNPHDAAGAAAARGAQAEARFKAMDTNFDGNIGHDDLTSSLKQTDDSQMADNKTANNKTADNGQRANGPLNTYGQHGSMTISVSITQTQFSITA